MNNYISQMLIDGQKINKPDSALQFFIMCSLSKKIKIELFYGAQYYHLVVCSIEKIQSVRLSLAT
jgi:hypothetical protein